MALLVLAGCGTQNSTTNGQASTTPANHTNTTATASSKTTSTSLKKQHIYLTVLPGGKLGSDGKKHDAFSPSNFTLVKGVPTTITIYNFDDMKHSVTNSKLGLNIQANPSKKDGKPGVTTVTFTPKQVGDFTWQCVDPCDTDNNGWAMSHTGYMKGTIHVVPNQKATQDISLTVMPGGKLGPDGKKHDAFLPANFTMQKGVPVKLTIYNYDDMKHSITSPKLNLNVQANPSKKDGKAGVTTVTFTPKQAGTFQWNCVDPCDTDNNGWAMSHSGYMMGNITVQ
ncbi:hypothetical protein [Alicyclobacillus sp. SO9]|uniref:hypothetical protein n=1 Tax=Alicyclobacillus sp. SO9 TaxID=2665646 RepID=UPI0018E79EA1|nr:hypothetical protein [Alicyclobacillus sp. SO9]QQE78461.1 hypothetical protein GI364_21740 [Alicyclobacillus sp. SO9]